MLIIPFDRPIDWRRPPVVTLALVAVNVLVFLGFQLGDQRAVAEAFSYYYEESRLPQTELVAYRDYLREQGEHAFVAEHGDRLNDPQAPWLRRLLADGAFRQALEADRIITPQDPEYAQWRSQHDTFTAKLNDSTTFAYGYRPAEQSPLKAFASAFLHGGLMHLLGNMIFLVAVGFLVEMTLGPLVFLGLYLLGQLGSVALFTAAHSASMLPSVGASGAIAGLMGMYAVIYGLRRIRFFYFIFVYFDYIKAPAIVLLPLWLGNELFQYLRYAPVSNVAYTAHMGGLLTGATAAFAVKRLTGAVDHDYIEEAERNESFEARLAGAKTEIRELRPERAVTPLRQLAVERPDDQRVLAALYDATKFEPASDAYHDAARRILLLPGTDPATEAWVSKTYRDYCQRARPRVRLSRAVVRALSARFIARHSVGEAEPLVRIALANAGHFPDAPELAHRFATACAKAGDPAKARSYYRHIIERFPDSDAAAVAERALARLR